MKFSDLIPLGDRVYQLREGVGPRAPSNAHCYIIKYAAVETEFAPKQNKDNNNIAIPVALEESRLSTLWVNADGTIIDELYPSSCCVDVCLKMDQDHFSITKTLRVGQMVYAQKVVQASAQVLCVIKLLDIESTGSLNLFSLSIPPPVGDVVLNVQRWRKRYLILCNMTRMSARTFSKWYPDILVGSDIHADQRGCGRDEHDNEGFDKVMSSAAIRSGDYVGDCYRDHALIQGVPIPTGYENAIVEILGTRTDSLILCNVLSRPNSTMEGVIYVQSWIGGFLMVVDTNELPIHFLSLIHPHILFGRDIVDMSELFNRRELIGAISTALAQDDDRVKRVCLDFRKDQGLISNDDEALRLS